MIERGKNSSQAIREYYEDTLPFGGEFVTIRFSTDKLREDFINEAINQGINPDEAEEARDRLEFGVGELINHPWSKSGNPLLNLVRRIGPELGWVSPVGDDSYYCCLNLKNIVTCIESGKGINNFKMGKMPQEARQAAVAQLLSIVWTHERQHLIQNLSKEKHSRYLHHRKIAFRGCAIAGLGYLIGLGAVTIREYRVELLIMAVTTSLAGVYIFYNNEDEFEQNVPSEGEAHEVESTDRKSLFDISFEK